LTPLQCGHNIYAGEEGRAARETFYATLMRKEKYHGKTGLSAK